MACSVIGVNGFDQPDVQDNKDRTNRKVMEYKETGRLDEGKPLWADDSAKLFGPVFPGFSESQSLKEQLRTFLSQSSEGDFIAINAYIPRNSQTFAQLQALRKRIQDLTGKPTTLGFGPRFLHSTGQYHKGGRNQGIFLQITTDPKEDLDIPGQGLSFKVLERSQALGDLEALIARKRRAIRVHLVDGNIDQLLA